ncbi:3'-5' exonuclease [Streptomyces sp. NPDC096079]|uniref:3'-5' exonuclease n=1 Tax=Streptomyces sp. NPDC096079 TaxID=3155820 RepID=UPI00331BE13C
MKVAPEQRPRAYVRLRMPYVGADYVALYDPAEAVQMRPLSERQKQQLRERRTCTLCGTVQARPLWSAGSPHTCPWLPEQTRGGRICQGCKDAAREQWERTCQDCGTEFRNLGSLILRQCQACRERYKRGREIADRLTLRHCPECTAQTATREEIEEARAADLYMYSFDFPRTCEACQAEQRRRALEARKADERARWDELGPVREWARHVVAQPQEYAILDTETTGLDGDAKVVEISVTDGAGNPLLDTLVNPGAPIPDEARAIHGIGDEDVQEAPKFGAILSPLTRVLAGRKVVIYNREYDTRVLAYELDRHHREHAPTLSGIELPPHEPHPEAVAWMEAQEWSRCAMHAYAVHMGEWSSYWGGWQWQRLNGGHRALGDCHAVAGRIKEMAETPDPF